MSLTINRYDEQETVFTHMKPKLEIDLFLFYPLLCEIPLHGFNYFYFQSSHQLRVVNPLFINTRLLYQSCKKSTVIVNDCRIVRLLLLCPKTIVKLKSNEQVLKKKQHWQFVICYFTFYTLYSTNYL